MKNELSFNSPGLPVARRTQGLRARTAKAPGPVARTLAARARQRELDYGPDAAPRRLHLPGLADLDPLLRPEAIRAQGVDANVRWTMRQILETPERRERQAEVR